MAPLKPGLWPDRCVQRAFVDGAEWWTDHHFAESTIECSDTDLTAEAEAIKRYGDPGPAHHGYGCDKDGDPMVEWCDVCHRLAKEQEKIGY